MLCVTGAEESAQAWRARAEAHPAHMHELRLDAMAAPEQALEQLGTLPARTVACCRAARQAGQGGGYRGQEAARLALLRQAQQQGAAWVDVEADVPDEALSGMARERVLLSWHDYARADADTIEQALARMRGRSGALKLAVTVGDTADLQPLLSAQPGQPAVLLAMGSAGLLSRCCYPAFGSSWSYAAASDTQHTAPGQLSLARAERWGLPASATLPLMVLLGAAQVHGSPGPDTYNPLLQARPDAKLYLPLVTRRLDATLRLLRQIGTIAASVTMPLKRDALALSRPDALARQVGAVNSLAWRDGAWHGTNTDVAGVAEPLRRAFAQLDTPPRQALLLGAGGAAAAALLAAQQLGLTVTVAARRPELAREALGTNAVVPWEQRAEIPHAVLINSTPLIGEQSPWPASQPIAAQVVLDMGLTPTSRLLDDARAAGAITLDGYDMWLAQGAAQMSWMLGERVDEAALRVHLQEQP